MKFGHKKLETLRYHTVKIRSLILTWSPGLESVPGYDRWMDGQTEGRIMTASMRLAPRAVAHKQGHRSIWDRGDTSPQYLDWGTLSRMSPSIFLE